MSLVVAHDCPSHVEFRLVDRVLLVQGDDVGGSILEELLEAGDLGAKGLAVLVGDVHDLLEDLRENPLA